MVAVENIINFCICALVLGVWLLTKHWFFNDVLAVGLVFFMLKMIKLYSYKVGAVLLVLLLIYDVFWVYITPHLFRSSVMAIVAQQLNLPIKIELPLIISQPMQPCVLLGLGDMVFPGFFIDFIYRFSKKLQTNIYFLVAIFCYITALALCGIVLVVYEQPQPALFYISPLLLIPLMIVAYRRDEHRQLWNGLETGRKLSNEGRLLSKGN